MNETILIHLVTQLLWIIMMLALPVVAAVALVSISISIFQTLTQIQDQSVQFIFKLLTASLILLFGYRWIGSTLLNYSEMVFMQLSTMQY